MGLGIAIDYQAVENAVAGANATINSSSVIADYTRLLNGFTESKGEQAEAIRKLLRTEQALMRQLEMTLKQFAGKIQTSANEFKKVDRNMANQIGSS